MQQINVDFDVWKALTVLRKSEAHTYNQVLRDLLKIGPENDHGTVVRSLDDTMRGIGVITRTLGERLSGGFQTRGLFLPNGTMLRATHKGQSYAAKIAEGVWVDSDGKAHTSPSAAASAITGNNVNGWRFWQAKRPSDAEWRNLDSLPLDRT